MNTPNAVLMKSARETLKGRWTLAVKATLVYFVISLILGMIPFIKFFSPIFATPALLIGMIMFWIQFSHGQNPSVDSIFDGFNTWWRFVKAYWLVAIYTLLWTLLLIIPGIIASLSYSMTFYIISEDKDIGIDDAISKSKKMMDGNKWKLVRLGLRFFGWSLLGILTLGIGFIWITPYMQVAMVKFYDDIKGGNGPETAKIPETIPAPAA